MELEQRVQALEQEMQVLKNQIQATLLDIQEYLLTNKYPTLRAEDAPVARSARPNGAAPQAAYLQASDNSREAPAPNIRRVSLTELAGADDEEEENYPRPRPNPAGRPGSRAARASNWSEDADEPAHQQRMKAGENAPRRVAPAPTDEATRPRRPDEMPSAGRTPRPKVEKRTQPAVPASQPVRQTVPPVPAPVEDEDSNHNLVLRLIAGVANAGVNNRRKKNG
ncbi:MAG: hypothetical protein HZC41_26020 [Chloroflexi bacterium]|nr:hypothetical protein [Chloroflexota bacterium]